MDVTEESARKRQWEEWSANVELDLLHPFLDEIVPLIDSGFGSQQVQQVIDLANGMPVGQEKSLKFPIVMKGRKSLLGVRLFMDDVASPDVYLTAEPILAGRLRSSLEEFMSNM